MATWSLDKPDWAKLRTILFLSNSRLPLCLGWILSEKKDLVNGLITIYIWVTRSAAQ